MEICPLCNKQGKSVKYHFWRMHGDGRSHNPNIGYKNGTRSGWNKGLTKDSDERIKVASEKCSRSTKGKPRTTPISDSAKQKLSKIAIEREFGGSNRNKHAHGWYESPYAGKVWLESSYEFKVAKILDENKIEWKRPKHLNYIIDGKKKRYFPDFFLVQYNLYLDPKNDFLIQKDKEKIRTVCKQNNVEVVILDSTNLTLESILARLV
jgi:hypothetical protein